MTYSIGIDVGTGSVRAALVHIETGNITSSKVCDIQTFNPEPDFYEQSSQNIYEAICDCVKEVTKGVQEKERIIGIGCDATCSLVVVDENGNPLSVAKTGERERNIILWMDHRALGEAQFINDSFKGKTDESVLKYVGGIISPEMETPKILWIKNNLPELYNRVDTMTIQYFDLADWVVYKMTGNNTIRGSCTTVCKWTYVSGEGWDRTYFEKVGLGKLSKSNFKAIGETIVPIGTPAGTLLPKICDDFGGLSPKTVISVGIIDAHGAGIGCMGGSISSGEKIDYSTRMALIAGTSCCHMAVNRSDVFVHGVWGPYRDAMIPGYSLSEGGQSAVGEALAHILRSHPFGEEGLSKIAEDKETSKFDLLIERLKEMTHERKLEHVSYLTKDVHVLPYFHGNRSPIADPSLKGMICGLTLDKSLDNLAVLFLATIQALAYGTKHIVDEMNKCGHKIEEIYICGGLNKNEFYKREHCQILNMNIVTPKVELTPCLGSGILGAVAAKVFPSIEDAMSKMCKIDEVLKPIPDEELKLYHFKKFKIYRKMYEDQISYRKIMNDNV